MCNKSKVAEGKRRRRIRNETMIRARKNHMIPWNLDFPGLLASIGWMVEDVKPR